MKKKLDQVVYEYIVGRIEIGDLLVREHITEQYVANTLDISRTPVRKAFTRLVDEGYLEDIPNVGVRVKQQDITTADFQEQLDLFEKLINFYLFDLEKKEIEFAVDKLTIQIERLKAAEAEQEIDFTKEELIFWEEVLKHSQNSYSKKILLKTLKDSICITGTIGEILEKSRPAIVKNLEQLVTYLAVGNYAYARREIRILLNQLKLNVIEMG